MVPQGAATSLLLAELIDFREAVTSTSTLGMCCITVELRLDIRNGTLIIQSHHYHH